MWLLLLGACAPELPPQRVLDLLASGGPVLLLPLEVASGVGAPAGTERYWERVARAAGVERAAPPADGLDGLSPLYADPLVPLAVDAYEGEARFALPEAEPGVPLARLGVASVVVFRDRMGEQALSLLEPLLARCLEPPQRDLVAGVELWPVPPARGEPPPPLPLLQGPLREGWLSLEEAVERWP